MSKRKLITLLIIVVLVTNAITFTLTNLMSVTFNNKAYIPKAEYDRLKSVMTNFLRSSMLKNILRITI